MNSIEDIGSVLKHQLSDIDNFVRIIFYLNIWKWNMSIFMKEFDQNLFNQVLIDLIFIWESLY